MDKDNKLWSMAESSTLKAVAQNQLTGYQDHLHSFTLHLNTHNTNIKAVGRSTAGTAMTMLVFPSSLYTVPVHCRKCNGYIHFAYKLKAVKTVRLV